MEKGLVDTDKLQKGIDKRKSKATKNSPSKRTQRAVRRGGHRGRRNYVEIDDMTSDSDLDESVAAHFAPAHHARRPPHDPNTIVLDCDDVFVGGPAVNFTRNIAGANAVSVEQSQEMKVSVRINNKVEQFRMNPVSSQCGVCCLHLDVWLIFVSSSEYSQFQKLSVLITQISEKKNLPSNQIALMLKDKTLSESETLNSVGYIQGLILSRLNEKELKKEK